MSKDEYKNPIKLVINANLDKFQSALNLLEKFGGFTNIRFSLGIAKKSNPNEINPPNKTAQTYPFK
jgi:hypothetical protein